MWFRFPEGTDQISIEQQNFTVEAEDADGGQFFRAPDHFAPIILGLLGFSRATPPEGAPEDLPPANLQRANEVDQLSAELQSAREENKLIRQKLGEAQRERDGLQTEYDDLKAEYSKLKEQRDHERATNSLETRPERPKPAIEKSNR